MSGCRVQASGTIDLYFYGELTAPERDSVDRHLSECGECRHALDELSVIREALELRPDVAAPPGGDWSAFMARLQEAVQAERMPAGGGVARVVSRHSHNRLAAAFATAALIALATSGVLLMMRDRGTAPASDARAGEVPVAADSVRPAMSADAALGQVSEQHFEKSKLVVLGLATKDPADPSAADWDYERTLARSLLKDTRLYRQAAEEQGMTTLAGVMRDLELVLLQTSMSEAPDAASLAQIQRLIRRRDLLTKMNVVVTTATTGL